MVDGMNKEDIIRMAREAGAVFPVGGSYHCFEIPGTLERFAALVAAAEREACAKVCEAQDHYERDDPRSGYSMKSACAEAIRARGQA